MFAAPFLCQLGNGHVDGVYQLAKDPNSLNHLASGSGDGIIKVWDLSSREQTWHAAAHTNIVKGMSWTRDQKLLTCGSDRKIQLFDPYHTPAEAPPISTWLGNNGFTSLSHHRSKNAFAASSGSVINIYDLDRHSAAPEVLQWPTSTDTITAVSFNQIEQSVLASVASDRSIVLCKYHKGSCDAVGVSFERQTSTSIKAHLIAVLQIHIRSFFLTNSTV